MPVTKATSGDNNLFSFNDRPEVNDGPSIGVVQSLDGVGRQRLPSYVMRLIVGVQLCANFNGGTACAAFLTIP